MPGFEVVKFGLRIRTRSDSTVDQLAIQGKDLEDASRKLGPMYRHCEVLESWPELTPLRMPLRPAGQSFEDVVGLIVPPR